MYILYNKHIKRIYRLFNRYIGVIYWCININGVHVFTIYDSSLKQLFKSTNLIEKQFAVYK